MASSSVGAVPFVTPGVAGTMAVIDQRHRSSGGRSASLLPGGARPTPTTARCGARLL